MYLPAAGYAAANGAANYASANPAAANYGGGNADAAAYLSSDSQVYQQQQQYQQQYQQQQYQQMQQQQLVPQQPQYAITPVAPAPPEKPPRAPLFQKTDQQIRILNQWCVTDRRRAHFHGAAPLPCRTGATNLTKKPWNFGQVEEANAGREH